MKDLRWHTCTKEDPWRPDMVKRGVHPEAICGEQQDGYPGGDTIDWRCPICGVKWTEELPQ